MKKIKGIIIVVIILVSAVFFITKRKIELSHAPVVGQHPIMVYAVYVEKRDIKDHRDYLAQVLELNQANVSARITAVVNDVLVDEGYVVKKGAILAHLDQRDLNAKLLEAKSEISASKANLSYWKQEYEWDENLFANGAISSEENNRVKNSLAQAQARYTKAKENVEYMKTNLSYSNITAPFDGIVAKRLVDPGDLATVGKPLFIINDQSRLKLVFAVPQEDIHLIKKGQLVLFQNGAKTDTASITNIFPVLEKEKTVTVEAYLKDNTAYLPGTFVSVRVIISEQKDVLVLPKTSIIFPNKGVPYIFLIKDNKLHKLEVLTGIITEQWVEIKNIALGTAVVNGSYLSQTSLSDGQTVTVGDNQ